MFFLFLSKKENHKNQKQTNKNKSRQKIAKARQKKCLQKNHEVCLVLANYSWAWTLLRSVVNTPSDILLEITNSPFAREYPL